MPVKFNIHEVKDIHLQNTLYLAEYAIVYPVQEDDWRLGDNQQLGNGIRFLNCRFHLFLKDYRLIDLACKFCGVACYPILYPKQIIHFCQQWIQ